MGIDIKNCIENTDFPLKEEWFSNLKEFYEKIKPFYDEVKNEIKNYKFEEFPAEKKDLLEKFILLLFSKEAGNIGSIGEQVLTHLNIEPDFLKENIQKLYEVVHNILKILYADESLEKKLRLLNENYENFAQTLSFLHSEGVKLWALALRIVAFLDDFENFCSFFSVKSLADFRKCIEQDINFKNFNNCTFPKGRKSFQLNFCIKQYINNYFDIFKTKVKINSPEDEKIWRFILPWLVYENCCQSQQEKKEEEKVDFYRECFNLKSEKHIINSFYNALKTKGFVILAGLSGTGKTKIFEDFVKCFPYSFQNHLFFPIRPDFRDSKSLLGFYNPLTKQYHFTPLLELILEATKNYMEKGKDADPFFVLFDEMNLARVEYYFADFLSVLETKKFSDKDEALNNKQFLEFLETLGLKEKLNDENFKFTSQSIKLHNEDIKGILKELFLPPNLYFVGTVNIDETTYMFSPKVLDRAFTIEFDVGSFEEYLEFLNQEKRKRNSIPSEELKKDFANNGDFAVIDKDKIREFFKEEGNRKYLNELERINEILERFNLHFGYRVFDEIVMFLYNSQSSLFRFENLDEAFDLAVKMKVLPKFHGTRQKLEQPIKELLKEFCKIENPDGLIDNGIPTRGTIKEKTHYVYTAHKLLEMLYKLKTQGFASFI